MRKLKKTWRDAAEAYARFAWHVPEFRYWIIEDKTKLEIAETASKMIRERLSFAFSEALRHPRSNKAQDKVRELARELGSISFYIQEHTL